MSKTFKFDPRNPDQQNSKQAKQQQKMQGRLTKQHWRNVSTQDKE